VDADIRLLGFRCGVQLLKEAIHRRIRILPDPQALRPLSIGSNCTWRSVDGRGGDDGLVAVWNTAETLTICFVLDSDRGAIGFY
jgi:hypothetical protein